MKMKLVSMLFISLAFLMSMYFTPTIPHAHAVTPPTGSRFDNIVIIAMENQPYSLVLGTGSYTSSNCGSGPAPFLDCSLAYASTIPEYEGYGASGRSVTGCSAMCYVALTAGNSTPCGYPGDTCNPNKLNQDSYCPTSQPPPCLLNPNIASTFSNNGLTYQMYCESGCPRHADHFPWIAYSITNPSNCQSTDSCTNIHVGSSVSTSTFVTEASISNPPNFLWYTPTDSNNMHDNSISSGDTYLKNFLVGSSGSIVSPSAGSLLATPLFSLNKRTLLVVWWDEACQTSGTCGDNDAPILFYDPSAVRPGFVSAGTGFDHYSVLRMIEDNWGLSTLTSNDAAATGLLNEIAPAPIASPAIMTGWGGVGLKEVQQSNTTNIVSAIGNNINGHATNTEQIIYTLARKGMNAVRIDIDPSCSTGDGAVYGQYNIAQFTNVTKIAQHYNFWVILDYHGFDEFDNSTIQNCWLSQWSVILGNGWGTYLNVILEPLNEPRGVTMTQINNGYQAFLNQNRHFNYNYWVVVQNQCSFGCSFTTNGDGNGIGAVQGFPTVNDTIGHVFESLHSYMAYSSYSGSWNNATADTVARGYYRSVLGGLTTYGWPILNTEGGADPICNSCAPDKVLTGSAGYSKTTFRFIQQLTNFYDNGTSRIAYTWWTAGSWTDTPGANQYGALQCTSSPKGYGCLLSSKPAVIAFTLSPATYGCTLPCGITYTVQSWGFSGTVTFSARVLSGDTANFSPTSAIIPFIGQNTTNFSISGTACSQGAIMTIYATSGSLQQQATTRLTCPQRPQ